MIEAPREMPQNAVHLSPGRWAIPCGVLAAALQLHSCKKFFMRQIKPTSSKVHEELRNNGNHLVARRCKPHGALRAPENLCGRYCTHVKIMILRHDKSWFFWIHFEKVNCRINAVLKPQKSQLEISGT